MKKDPKVLIEHIVESITLIEHYAESLTLAKFKENMTMQDAIICRLEIIGEAVKNIPSTKCLQAVAEGVCNKAI